MTKNIITPGDQFAAKGTTEWADWQRSRMKHALKDVHFEARQIVQVIRDMCEGEHPAWHLMTREDGIGFRTFEEFVTSPEGLRFPDYAKFRSIAISEPGIMNEREYELLTTAPTMSTSPKKDNESPRTEYTEISGRQITRLRAIGQRTDPVVRQLYIDGLIDARLAESLGPDESKPGGEERKRKAEKAVAKIKAIERNGDDAAYRKAVNEAVRKVFGKRAVPSPLEVLRKAWAKATKQEREKFIEEIGKEGW